MADPALALGVQALGWAVLLPFLSHLATQLDGTSPAPSPVTQEARSHV
jgi:hypothetical protein